MVHSFLPKIICIHWWVFARFPTPPLLPCCCSPIFGLAVPCHHGEFLIQSMLYCHAILPWQAIQPELLQSSLCNISSPWSSTTCSVSLQLAVPRTLMSRRDLHLLGDSSSVCSELLQILVWWRQNDICGCQFLTVEATFVGACEDLTWLISFLCVLLSPHFYLPHC